MGVFTDGEDFVPQEKEEIPQDKLETDVVGVFADNKIRAGLEEIPVFNVDRDSFFKNMHNDRKRLRFPSDSGAAQYLRGTQYRRPFFVSYTEADGKVYRRKVK